MKKRIIAIALSFTMVLGGCGTDVAEQAKKTTEDKTGNALDFSVDGKSYNLGDDAKNLVESLCKEGLYVINDPNQGSGSVEVVGFDDGFRFYERYIDPVTLKQVCKNVDTGEEMSIPDGKALNLSFDDALSTKCRGLEDELIVDKCPSARYLYADLNKEDNSKYSCLGGITVGDDMNSASENALTCKGSTGMTSQITETKNVMIIRDGAILNTDEYVEEAKRIIEDKSKWADMFSKTKKVAKNLSLGLIAIFLSSAEEVVTEDDFIDRCKNDKNLASDEEEFTNELAFILSMNDLLDEYNDGRISSFGTVEFVPIKKGDNANKIGRIGINLYMDGNNGRSLRDIIESDNQNSELNNTDDKNSENSIQDYDEESNNVVGDSGASYEYTTSPDGYSMIKFDDNAVILDNEYVTVRVLDFHEYAPFHSNNNAKIVVLGYETKTPESDYENGDYYDISFSVMKETSLYGEHLHLAHGGKGDSYDTDPYEGPHWFLFPRYNDGEPVDCLEDLFKVQSQIRIIFSHTVNGETVEEHDEKYDFDLSVLQ